MLITVMSILITIIIVHASNGANFDLKASVNKNRNVDGWSEVVAMIQLGCRPYGWKKKREKRRGGQHLRMSNNGNEGREGR
jgi:hypothetical protein